LHINVQKRYFLVYSAWREKINKKIRRMKTASILILSIFLFFGCNQAKPKKKVENISVQKSVVSAPQMQSDTIFDFENYANNKLPENWSQYFTGRGDTTNWKIIEDEGNKVLAQLSQDRPNYHFNEIVFDGFKTKNVEMEVKMKGVKGKMDQGGGFVWRFQNADNYYVVRANPLEDNVVLYKVKDGRRTDLPVFGKGRTYGVDVKPLGNNWNSLKIIVEDDLFSVFLNGEEIFKVQDTTFENAGKVGLWTKADAVTYFDNLIIKMK
jgi:hypothetical protein